VRDYFVKQWDRFRHVPGSILAHSTHVMGTGTYDAATGIETPRIIDGSLDDALEPLSTFFSYVEENLHYA
jgi:hypothetical protein